jgi:hypothetical protein
MQPMYYIGLDVHKQKISYCVKDSSGKIYAEGWIRSLFDTGLKFEGVTSLVGSNGTGKTGFLHALNLFYSPTPRVEIHDFYNRETAGIELIVAVTYKLISDESKTLFSPYATDDVLTVERVFTSRDGQISWKYHGAPFRTQNFKTFGPRCS